MPAVLTEMLAGRQLALATFVCMSVVLAQDAPLVCAGSGSTRTAEYGCMSLGEPILHALHGHGPLCMG